MLSRPFDTSWMAGSARERGGEHDEISTELAVRAADVILSLAEEGGELSSWCVMAAASTAAAPTAAASTAHVQGSPANEHGLAWPFSCSHRWT